MDAKQNLQIQRVNTGILYVGSHTAPVRAFQIDSQLPRLKIHFFFGLLLPAEQSA